MTLAIHRKGKNLNMRMDKVRLQSSDTLLIQGTESSLNRLRSSEEVILLDQTLRSQRTPDPKHL